jgi:hypothetical protein
VRDEGDGLRCEIRSNTPRCKSTQIDANRR